MNNEKLNAFIQKYKWIFVFLCGVPFFNDTYVPIQGLLDRYMDHLKMFVVALLFVLMLIRKKKISPLAIILIVYEAWWMITTAINYPLSNQEAFYKTTIDIADILAMFLIVEYFLDTPEDLIKGLMLNMELAIYPNFVTVILQNIPGDRYYLIGFYAVLILWLLPAICVGTLHIILNKGYIRGTLLIAMSLLTSLLVSCATTTVAFMGMAGFIALGLILKKIPKTKDLKLPVWVFVLLAVSGSAFIMVYSGGNFPLIDFFIEKVLHRTTHFTGRIHIWRAAIDMIKEKPIIGHGYRVNVTTVYNFTVIHCHNQLLQVLNVKGVIGLAIIAVFHIVMCKKIDQSSDTIARLILSGAVFGVCITYMTEAYKKFFRLYLVFFLAYHVDELLRNKLSGTQELLK